MAIERSEDWFLRKHDSGEVFGPVPFEKIREWAHSAQVNAQDMLSTDQIIWTKAPMIAETEMDWLIVVGENVLYDPNVRYYDVAFLDDALAMNEGVEPDQRVRDPRITS